MSSLPSLLPHQEVDSQVPQFYGVRVNVCLATALHGIKGMKEMESEWNFGGDGARSTYAVIRAKVSNFGCCEAHEEGNCENRELHR